MLRLIRSPWNSTCLAKWSSIIWMKTSSMTSQLLCQFHSLPCTAGTFKNAATNKTVTKKSAKQTSWLTALGEMHGVTGAQTMVQQKQVKASQAEVHLYLADCSNNKKKGNYNSINFPTVRLYRYRHYAYKQAAKQIQTIVKCQFIHLYWWQLLLMTILDNSRDKMTWHQRFWLLWHQHLADVLLKTTARTWPYHTHQLFWKNQTRTADSW